MKPSDLSNKLRSIASKLDRSKNPSRTLVASELKRLVAAVATDFADDGKANSQLLWAAFKDLRMPDWQSSSDLNKVLAKMRELAVKAGVEDMEYALGYAKENFLTAKELGFPSLATDFSHNGKATSQLMWVAFKDLQMPNWKSSSDLKKVLSKMSELADKAGIEDTKYALGYAEENFLTAKELGFPG